MSAIVATELQNYRPFLYETTVGQSHIYNMYGSETCIRTSRNLFGVGGGGGWNRVYDGRYSSMRIISRWFNHPTHEVLKWWGCREALNPGITWRAKTTSDFSCFPVQQGAANWLGFATKLPNFFGSPILVFPLDWNFNRKSLTRPKF
jgi:hypothetical protein